MVEYEDMKTWEYSLLEEAINTFGWSEQQIGLIQECAELIKAITKDNKNNFQEELTDVYLMVKQLMIYFNKIPYDRVELRKWRRIKLNYLQGLIEEKKLEKAKK